MNYISWLEQEARLSSLGLTVRAQAIDPTDRGRLIWDTLFTRVEKDDLEFPYMSSVETRMVADRREFNAPGRLMPIVSPSTGVVSMTPIEAYHPIDEKELGKLRIQTAGNMDAFRSRLGASIPDRVDKLVMMDYRRLEVDMFSAWILNQLTVRNPQLGNATVIAVGMDATHFTTAGTAWSIAANAYNEFMAWYRAGIAEVGSAIGAMMSQVKVDLITEDAPKMWAGNQLNSVVEAEDRIAQALGRPFQFFPHDETADIFGTAGTARTKTRLFPVNHVALIPDGPIGEAAFAPVTRAMDLVEAAGDAGVDIRGCTVYYVPANDGKSLQIQAQLNAMCVPDEAQVWVINAGA